MTPENTIEPDYGSNKRGVGLDFNSDFRPHVEWKMLDWDKQVVSKTYNSTFSRGVVTLRMKRNAGFYIWKVLFPLLLVPLLAMSMFLFEPDQVADKLNIVLSMLLTVFAFLFVIAADLPKAGYLTDLDFIIVAVRSACICIYI